MYRLARIINAALCIMLLLLAFVAVSTWRIRKVIEFYQCVLGSEDALPVRFIRVSAHHGELVVEYQRAEVPEFLKLRWHCTGWVAARSCARLDLEHDAAQDPLASGTEGCRLRYLRTRDQRRCGGEDTDAVITPIYVVLLVGVILAAALACFAGRWRAERRRKRVVRNSRAKRERFD